MYRFAANRRRFERHKCDFRVELHVGSPGFLSICYGVARNISAGGLLIECATVPPPHSECHVAFNLPHGIPVGARSSRDVMVKAHVRHSDRVHGNFGVSFAHPLS